MPLYKHQQRIVDKAPKRILLAWGTGTGKSIASLELIKKHTDKYLVVCPKGLKQKWVLDVQRYHPSGDVVTKETFRRDWEKLTGYEGIIVDESHNFAGMKSAMSKSLIKWILKNKIEIRILLTATPYLSSPLNIYRLAQILGHKWNYNVFVNRFFYYMRMGQRMIPVVKKGIEGDIAKLVQEIGDVVRLDECIDVPDQTHEVESFSLNATQKKAIAKVESEELNPMVKFTKIHQIEQGTLKGGETYNDMVIDCDKNDRILELAGENQKIAVFCRYNLQIAALKKVLEAENHTVFVLNGETKDRHKVVYEVENSEKCVVLINSACSEGYELPSIGVIVFASLGFSFKDWKQSLGRFLRINNLKKNVYIYLVTTDGVDADVYKNIVIEKQDFDIAIYSNGRTRI